MSVAVGLGLMDFPFAGAGDYWRWVDLCEAGGVDSIWQTDRLVSRQPILECMAIMAALAGRTRRLRFGMNVVSLALRDPVLLAKQCATIDVLSEGRLLPAFGIGSPLGPEWEALDIDTKTRGRRTDESLEIIARLWRDESVDFDGKYYRLNGASISPKPVQPDLPMWIGGSSDAAVRRTAQYGTGWQGGGETLEDAIRVVAAIKKAAARGRPHIDEDHYGASFPFYFGSASDPVVSAGDGSLRQAHRPRPVPAVRRRRRRHDPRSGRRIRGRRRPEVHPAAGRARGEQCIAQTQAAHREGAAARRARWPEDRPKRPVRARSEGEVLSGGRNESASRCSSPTTR